MAWIIRKQRVSCLVIQITIMDFVKEETPTFSKFKNPFALLCLFRSLAVKLLKLEYTQVGITL